jgi:hypothetical protein
VTHPEDLVASESSIAELLETDLGGEELFTVDESSGDIEVDNEQIDANLGVCEHLTTDSGQSGKLPKRIAVQFGRLTTKAEEVISALCGIILT